MILCLNTVLTRVGHHQNKKIFDARPIKAHHWLCVLTASQRLHGIYTCYNIGMVAVKEESKA